MQIECFDIKGPILFKPKIHSDERGNFIETFRLNEFESHTSTSPVFLQDNQSISVAKGTIRGLHFQTPPKPQGKLVRCISGEITDVAVDVRRGSPTYGQHIKAILTSKNAHQLWVPPGFLHGFATLKDDCIVAYKCTEYYSHQHDRNIYYNDPDLEIDWGVPISEAIVSAKDQEAPRFNTFKTPF